ncbi:hypothetical protein HZH68_013296 [Vespula germanica]|uniref:Uncharacterized protein n=1 Tax=Vespula germanica TaxID=30212 RepID=A0A834MWF7_VESGE|nr:hypothetical protein HZH68_013296 [Vespula germanica]
MMLPCSHRDISSRRTLLFSYTDSCKAIVLNSADLTDMTSLKFSRRVKEYYIAYVRLPTLVSLFLPDNGYAQKFIALHESVSFENDAHEEIKKRSRGGAKVEVEELEEEEEEEEEVKEEKESLAIDGSVFDESLKLWCEIKVCGGKPLKGAAHSLTRLSQAMLYAAGPSFSNERNSGGRERAREG